MTAGASKDPAGFAPGWNTRILVVDDQPEIHDDFRDMLVPEITSLASDRFLSTPAAPPAPRRAAGVRAAEPRATRVSNSFQHEPCQKQHVPAIPFVMNDL